MQVKPLRPLELAELGKRIDECVRIASHAKRATGNHVLFRGKSPVAQVRLGGRRKACMDADSDRALFASALPKRLFESTIGHAHAFRSLSPSSAASQFGWQDR